MDANGQRFWMVRGDGWQAEPVGSLESHPDRLRLASETLDHVYPEASGEAAARLDLVPMTRDGFGGRAYYDDTVKAIFATGELPGAVKIVDLSAPATDLALGAGGYFYVATGGAVLVRDPHGRLPAVEVKTDGIDAWRLAPDPRGGAWVLDRTHRQLARLDGQLWPAPLALNPPPDAFLPVQENPHPLRLSVFPGTWLDAQETPVALACGPAGRLAVLVWWTDPADPNNLQARVRLVPEGKTATLGGIKRPYSLAWISGERFAVLAAGVEEALVYTFADGEITPAGEIFPLRDHDGGPFLHGPSFPVQYPATPAPRPLVSVSLPAFPASATGRLATPFDSGTAGTAWHRFYVEAELPAETGFILYVAATDDGEAPDPAGPDWHPHHFGAAPANEPAPETVYDRPPLAAWVPARSEIPGFDGFHTGDTEKNRAGLFTVLIQRSHRAVRTLGGRFLHLRVELRGNARATPCIHAIRAYAPRFSYQDKYLPALYREQVFGPDADRNAPPTPADFLGRFLANFEGILTPLEDRVAGAALLTDARRTPDEALGWLGGWVGMSFEPWYPAGRRRERLRRAPELYRWRGTLRGLRLALDVATNGGVLGDATGRHRIAVVEDYWMRRTLATVLGVNLDRDFDPLLGGPLYTGNSRVGRTLFLGEGLQRELLALFDADLTLNPADEAAVDDLFASLAHRATVVVHEAANEEEIRLIQRIADREAPAHVIVRVRRASQDFMIGLAALLGVDTYLRAASPVAGMEVNRSVIGGGDVLLHPPGLDPRLEGAPLS